MRRRTLVALALIASLIASLLGLTGGRGPTAAGAAQIGDSSERMAISLYVCSETCSGIHVFIDSASHHYGSGGYSLCTNNETSTDFRPSYNGEVRYVSMDTKASGTCAPLTSYNTWVVEVYKNDKLLERGTVWLGEDRPLLAEYYASCPGKKSPWSPPFLNMQCQTTGRFNLDVSVPGWKPTWPTCPSESEFCSVSIHFDTNKPCSSFTSSVGACAGSSDGNVDWTTNKVDQPARFIYSAFTWGDTGGKKTVTFGTQKALPAARMTGSVPSSGSGILNVQEALVFLWAHPQMTWYTSNRGPAGTPGGPLLFNFRNGVIGADVYINGFLQRRP
jgi:hypothetical protein